jgi:hypothetical protein
VNLCGCEVPVLQTNSYGEAFEGLEASGEVIGFDEVARWARSWSSPALHNSRDQVVNILPQLARA